jgi:nicotinamide-nucleotide amidase
MIYNEKQLQLIRDRLIDSKQTIAVAESVSAGHLQAALSSAPDANCFFQGGITTYNLGQKTRLLDVEPIQALACDCVSKEVTEQMARKVCELFVSDYGVAVTGYATPVPEKGIKKLFAWISIVHQDKMLLSKQISPRNARAFNAQVHYVNTILEELATILQTKTG